MARPVFVLGGGSNLLVSDQGFDGLVVRFVDQTIRIEDDDGQSAVYRVGAGVDWDDFVAQTVGDGFAGLECLSGIPGRVGAVPVQNVGAYGQEVAETIEAVHAVNLETGETVRLNGGACGFAYRQSRFKSDWRGRYLITEVEFQLSRSNQGTLKYEELRRRFDLADGGPAPSPGAIRSEVLAVRRGKSMVIDASDPNRRSVGSFFVNPVVEPDVADHAEELAQSREPGKPMPRYPAPGHKVKMSAAWLIERAGFERGYVMGPAGLSTRHTLALINRGGARAGDILALARRIRTTVQARFGIVLVPEPVFLGFDVDHHGILE